MTATIHHLPLTPAEQTFDRDFREERDRLSAQYDRRPTYEPLDASATDDAEAGWAALLAFWLLVAFGAGMFLGSGLTVLAALLIDGVETLWGWL
jgi:hypothetical protein